MNKHLEKLTENINVLVIMRFGSQLYGTDTEKSDEDYKGIFIPTMRELFLNKVSKSIRYNSRNDGEKNTKDDVDIELYSIHYFIDLACKGETIAIDMLHCNTENIISNSLGWESIRENRKLFYTNNLKGFVGYCRKQAAKYGIKGSRLSSAKTVYEYLLPYVLSPIDTRLGDLWGHLPTGPHIHFVKVKTHGGKEEEFYQVCGKKMQATSKVSYCVEILKKFRESYGHRALLAEKNEGIDWKAVSHAIRYSYQIKELFETGDIVFPLKQAIFLKDIKLGKLSYLGEVAPLLESVMDEIEILSQKIDLPNKVNRKFWNNWLVELIKGSMVCECGAFCPEKFAKFEETLKNDKIKYGIKRKTIDEIISLT